MHKYYMTKKAILVNIKSQMLNCMYFIVVPHQKWNNIYVQITYQLEGKEISLIKTNFYIQDETLARTKRELKGISGRLLSQGTNPV